MSLKLNRSLRSYVPLNRGNVTCIQNDSRQFWSY